MDDHPSTVAHSFLARCEPAGIHNQCLPVFGSCPDDAQMHNSDYYIATIDQQQHDQDFQIHPHRSYESLDEHRSQYAYYAPCGYSYYISPENGGFGTVGVPSNANDVHNRIDADATAFRQRAPIYDPHHQTNLAVGCGSVGLPLAPEEWPGHNTAEERTVLRRLEEIGQGDTNGQRMAQGSAGFDWPRQEETIGSNSVISNRYHQTAEYEHSVPRQREYSDSPKSRVKAARQKSKRECEKAEEIMPKFQCLLCTKKYCRRSTLKTHLRHHSGERPYYCSVCGKTFAQAANLTAHKRIHTGEKPFACPICYRPFSQSSSLVTHKRTHTGEKPYQCPRCDKAFTDSSTLTKHVRTHTGVKPYTCGICLLSFSQSGNLNRHMKTHLKQHQLQ